MSARSFGLTNGIFSSTPGTFTPLWFEINPPFFTRQTISDSSMRTTSMPISPSSIRIESPGSTSLYNSLYVIVTFFSVPSISSVVSVNSWPGFNSSFPPSTSPIRISGPLVSRSAATGLSYFLRSSLSFWIRPLCSSWGPCEKLKRATSIPSLTSCSITSPLSVDGPIVQIILVFLI